VAELAQLKQTSENEMSRMLMENFLRLIDKDPWFEDARDLLWRSEP
jgi:hypothetical protein